MDEAHRLRNVYKSSNVTGKRLQAALQGRKKLLLTATPLQNNLMELYGLVSIIDEHVFGDAKTFREILLFHRRAVFLQHCVAACIADVFRVIWRTMMPIPS